MFKERMMEFLLKFVAEKNLGQLSWFGVYAFMCIYIYIYKK